jgi:hypothetical protein
MFVLLLLLLLFSTKATTLRLPHSLLFFLSFLSAQVTVSRFALASLCSAQIGQVSGSSNQNQG